MALGPPAGATAPALTLADPGTKLLPIWPENGLRPRNVTPGSATVTGGKVYGVDRVIAGMRAGFRACYQRGLASHPEQSGTLYVSVILGSSGEIVRATARRHGSLDDEVTECALRRIRSASFPPPNAPEVEVAFDVLFEPQPKEQP
jgi:hypothetical protein